MIAGCRMMGGSSRTPSTMGWGRSAFWTYWKSVWPRQLRLWPLLWMILILGGCVPAAVRRTPSTFPPLVWKGDYAVSQLGQDMVVVASGDTGLAHAIMVEDPGPHTTDQYKLWVLHRLVPIPRKKK